MIYGSWVIGSLGQHFGLYHVYRLEEDDSLLQEGGVRLPVWALRARSYKTRAEA